MNLKYRRALLKLSGEALKGKTEIYDEQALNDIADQIIKLAENKLQLGIVVGGGNIWRGKLGADLKMPQINADYMGMLATIMNALALESIIKEKGYSKVIVYSSLDIRTMTSPYSFKDARKKLNEGYILIFGGGTGHAYFTTDTAATLRAIEIAADVVLMAKNGIDGVYDKDPKQHKDAKFFEHLSYDDITRLNLQVMDQTAATLAKDGKLKIEVFNMQGENNLIKMVEGKLTSTNISE
jgi:uridylate kinase